MKIDLSIYFLPISRLSNLRDPTGFPMQPHKYGEGAESSSDDLYPLIVFQSYIQSGFLNFHCLLTSGLGKITFFGDGNFRIFILGIFTKRNIVWEYCMAVLKYQKYMVDEMTYLGVILPK